MTRRFSFILPNLFLLFAILQGCGEARTSRAKHACESGVAFLQSIQREDGAICDTADALFDVWETVLATTAMVESGLPMEDIVIKSAMGFLRVNEDSAGMICHNVKCRRSYCLETTSEYFHLLCLTGQCQLAAARMDSVLALQLLSGEWHIGNPDVTEQPTFPSVTAFVLGACRETNRPPIHEAECFAWLRQRQTEQGHWGRAWEYYECPAYAMWPVMRALKDRDAIGDINARRRATDYILASQQEDGSWHDTLPGRKRMPSAELQTALMLSALQYSYVPLDSDAWLEGIDFLLDHQRKDGSWFGGFFPVEQKRRPKEEYVIATARAICVLQHWLEAQP